MHNDGASSSPAIRSTPPPQLLYPALFARSPFKLANAEIAEEAKKSSQRPLEHFYMVLDTLSFLTLSSVDRGVHAMRAQRGAVVV